LTTYAALLRGVNVGGRNQVAMGDLRTLVTDLGHTDVSTYVQSGNVVLTSGANAAAVSRGIEQAIARELGLDITVLVRTRQQLAKVAAANPFDASDKYVHVLFLADRPTAGAVKALDPDRSPPDEFVVAGREVFLHYPNGSGRTKLNGAYFESKLDTRGTARNFNTVNKLLALTAR
jgi:uncharacterized protein (DUF1697 family)